MSYGAALVLGTGTNGLGMVRSLHQKGIYSVVISRSNLDETHLTRLSKRKFRIPPNQVLAESLLDIISRASGEVDCVIAGSDQYASALQLLSETGRLNLACVLPPRNLIDTLNDKRSEIELIRHLDIPMPNSIIDLTLSRDQLSFLVFPVIVKPRRQSDVEVLGFKNRIFLAEPELVRFLQEFESKLDSFIAQEIIPGTVMCQWVCNAVFDQDSEMKSAFTFQRLGTIPHLYGVTTFAVSRHNSEIKDLCARIGRDLKYVGSAMLEFKLDPRSGEYCYIEINPRIGMCNWFDTECGVNNVYNAYALALGLPLEKNIDGQTEGRAYMDFWSDIYARRRAEFSWRSISLHYIGNFPRRVVRPAWYWKDPLPAIAPYIRAIGKRLTGNACRNG